VNGVTLVGSLYSESFRRTLMKLNLFDKIFSGIFVVWFTVFVFAAYGYVANIVKIIGSDFQNLDVELIIRLVGVIAGPLGAVMGYI
jgi:hypothetical protein